MIRQKTEVEDVHKHINSGSYACMHKYIITLNISSNFSKETWKLYHFSASAVFINITY